VLVTLLAEVALNHVEVGRGAIWPVRRRR
jgi:hypothetical protein